MGKVWLGVILAGWLITPLSAAEGDRMLATPEVPAVVTASRSVAVEATESARPPRVVVSVAGYQPARDGSPVQIIVKARDRSGADREIGRFGIVPNTPFKVGQGRARRFGLPLPVGISGTEPLKLSIYIEAVRGAGAGAQVEIGGVEVR